MQLIIIVGIQHLHRYGMLSISQAILPKQLVPACCKISRQLNSIHLFTIDRQFCFYYIVGLSSLFFCAAPVTIKPVPVKLKVLATISVLKFILSAGYMLGKLCSNLTGVGCCTAIITLSPCCLPPCASIFCTACL